MIYGHFCFWHYAKIFKKPILFERHSWRLFKNAQNWPQNRVKSLIVKMYVR